MSIDLTNAKGGHWHTSNSMWGAILEQLIFISGVGAGIFIGAVWVYFTVTSLF